MQTLEQLSAISELDICHQAGITTLTLNRPEANNALNRALSEGLVTAMQALSSHEATRVIVLTGAGRAFCAGVDLKALTEDPGMLTGKGLGTESPMVVAFRQCKPIIGAINGAAVTGGFELALACDFLYASESARFADTHARVGILPGWGLSQKLSRIIGINRAREMSLTGRFISANTAYDWGLVNEVIPDANLLERAMRVARDIADADGPTVVALNQLMTDGWQLPLSQALELEGERARAHVSGVDFTAMNDRLQSLRARAKDNR